MADVDPVDSLFTQAMPQTGPTPENADPLVDMFARQARKQAGLALVSNRNANPDQAGQANALARETGLPADVVQRNLAEVQARQRAQANQAILAKSPAIANWASQPRNAAVAHDDLGILDRVGSTIWGGIKALGGALNAGVAQVNSGFVYGGLQALTELDPSVMVQRALGIPVPRNLASEATVRWAQARRKEADAYAAAQNPSTGNFVADSLLSGVASLPTTVIAGGLGLMGAPGAGLAVMGGTQAGQSYTQARDQGVTPGKAGVFAASQGAIEIATEAPSYGFLVNSLGKVGLPHFLAGFIGRELTGEEIATVTQDLNDWAVLHPNQSLADYARDHASDPAQTALATLAMGGAAGALHAGLHVAHGRAQADAGKAGATFTDNLMAQAAKAKTRERDPQAFRDFIAAHTEGTPVENAYVPGEKLREFFQSDRFDPEDASHQWLGGLSDQANEAAALGGDVVIPLADAATHLAGSTAWDAIKDDVRVTPGGLSAREAKDYAESHADAMEQLGKQAEEAYRADQEARAPVEKVYEDVRQRLVESGQPLDAANHLAQLYAAHAQAWGARLGTDALAYHEQTAPEFKQILPPALAKVQAADQTDLLINALKRGAEGTSAGASLLDFISKAGGVEDKGGDIASMGGDKWHREKRFRAKLIREGVNQEEALPGMGGGIGAATGYGLDDVAQRAWEAGYFPDMHERPTTNDLLDAIGRELRGSPIHAQAHVEQQQHIADAVEELRGILNQRGVDAEKATRETIRQELQRYSQEQAGGRGYEQPAYHGSPHIFDRFSLDKIGTGEGAQAYGYGLYFAGRKEIAQHYRDALAGNVETRLDGVPIMDIWTKGEPEQLRALLASLPEPMAGLAGISADETREHLKRWGWANLGMALQSGWSLNRGDVTAGLRQYAEQQEKWAESNGTHADKVEAVSLAQIARAIADSGRLTSEHPGRLYHVEIPEDGEYLLWDKPLSEQPEKVKAALEKLGFKPLEKPDLSEITDPLARPIIRKALQLNEGSSDHLAHIIDNDYELYQKADRLARRAGLTDEDIENLGGTGYYVEQRAQAYLDKLRAYETDNLGHQVYNGLATDGGPQAASKALHDAGIAGIKYLDGGSRSDGEGSHNYVVFDDNAVSIRHYEQTYNEGVRGRATFSSGKPLIELFQAADLSTIVHETGHVWLEELRNIAERDDAPADVKADWQSVQDWFAASGHAMQEGMIPTEAHELWARGFERFAMEGKAPSSALRRAFDAFRSWLLNIYKVVDNLRAPITPEIRDVMNRMIATQEEIDQAEEAQNLKALFTDAAQAGMTEEEFAAYQASTQDARNEAYDALIYKTMHAIRKARTKEWKADEATVKADVTDRINKRPEFRALHLLRTGKWLGEPDREGMKVRLDRQWLVDSYGNEALSMLPKGVPPIYGEKGANADELAELTGFRTGDEMVRTLMGLETAQKAMRDEGDKRSVKQRLIDEETAQEMRDRYGDPLNDGSIEEEALAAVHNDRQGELIAFEARALTRKTGGAPTPYRVAREWASRKIAEGKVADVASRSALQRYARTAAKAAKAAEDAILKGDVDETFRQKQAQLLNHALLVEAKKAADEVDVAVSRLGKIAKRATMKSVDQDYLNRAHALLERYSFRPMSQAGLDERERFREWAAEQVANGIDVVTPPRLAGDAEHYSRISVEELRGLRDSVEQLMHLGRHKQRLIDEKDARDYDAARDEMLGGLGNLPPLPVKPNIEPGRWGKFKDTMIGLHASLTKMGRMIFVMDGGNTNGPFHRYIWRPLANAATRESDLMADVQRRNGESLAAVPKETLKRFDEHLTVPEMPGADGDTVWSRSQLHQMARNAGTAENWRILCEGRGWNPDAAMSALDRELSREEWEYVQRDLETVGSFWPEIKALYERVNGIAPPKVDAQPIVTRHGTFPGGYYPLVPDSTANPVIERKMQSDELFNVLFTRSTTRNGFINERTGATYVVSLAPGVSQRHVMEVVHDFTHREAVMQADKFLSDDRIVTAMRQTIGLEMQKQFRPWLKAVANQWAQDKTGVEAAEKIANKMRTHMSIMGMGYRISTMMQQLAGYANSLDALGTDAEKWMLSGVKSVAGMGPGEAFRFASERSGLVRHRMEQVDLTQEQELKKLQGKRGIGAEVRRFAFHGIGIMDRVVVIPTWHAGYNKAMAEGMSEEDAVAYADHVVNASQGAAGMMNAAAIQRKQGMSSLLVMFYSYGSAYYNRQSQLARDWKGAVTERRARDIPRLMARTWWLMLAPNLISTLIQGWLGQGPDDDESYAAWLAMGTLTGIFTGVPFVNSAVSSAVRGFGYSASPLDRAVTTAGKAALDAWHTIDDYVPEGLPGADPDGDTEPSSRWARNGIESLGYLTGMPFGQAGTATQFVIDWANGDQDPQTAGEWLRGLQTGKAERKRDQ